MYPTPRSLYEAWLRCTGRPAPSGGFLCRQTRPPAASPARLLEGIEARCGSRINSNWHGIDVRAVCTSLHVYAGSSGGSFAARLGVGRGVLDVPLTLLICCSAAMQVFAGGTKISQALSQKIVEALFGA